VIGCFFLILDIPHCIWSETHLDEMKPFHERVRSAFHSNRKMFPIPPYISQEWQSVFTLESEEPARKDFWCIFSGLLSCPEKSFDVTVSVMNTFHETARAQWVSISKPDANSFSFRMQLRGPLNNQRFTSNHRGMMTWVYGTRTRDLIHGQRYLRKKVVNLSALDFIRRSLCDCSFSSRGLHNNNPLLLTL
jgi:hypothetical protein